MRISFPGGVSGMSTIKAETQLEFQLARGARQLAKFYEVVRAAMPRSVGVRIIVRLEAVA
jgi:hypothetical protein